MDTHRVFTYVKQEQVEYAFNYEDNGIHIRINTTNMSKISVLNVVNATVIFLRSTFKKT